MACAQLTGAADQAPDCQLPVVTEAKKNNNNESNNSRMSSLELAERIWQDFHGHNPHTLLFNPQMCFPFKCDTVFPTV